MQKSRAIGRISGIVKKHLGRGQRLGFPTANLDIKTGVPDGVYLGYAVIKKQRLPALIFIGAAKTFGERKRQVEVHILDFDRNIYGEKIRVEIIKKLRDIRKFASEGELTVQLKADATAAKNYFGKTSGAR